MRSSLAGDATITRLDASGVSALTTSASYDVTLPEGAPPRISAQGPGVVRRRRSTSRFSRWTAPSRIVDERLDVDLSVAQSDTIKGSVKGVLVVDTEQRTLDIRSLNLTVQESAWQLAPARPPPRVTWDDGRLSRSAR